MVLLGGRARKASRLLRPSNLACCSWSCVGSFNWIELFSSSWLSLASLIWLLDFFFLLDLCLLDPSLFLVFCFRMPSRLACFIYSSLAVAWVEILDRLSL